MSSALTSLAILLTNFEPADAVRSALEGREELWFLCLLIASGGVAVGCILEIPETWEDLKEWRRIRQESESPPGWRVPMAAVGLLLVVLGVIGEGVFEALVSISETSLRAHDEQVLGETVREAGTAKESAERAQKAAEIASEASGAAMEKATEASATADKAGSSAHGALTAAEGARAQADVVQRNIAVVDEKYAPRTLSETKRGILIEILRKAPIKPKEPIEISFDVTAFDGEAYGKEVASAINDPSTGWKATGPIASTGDGEKIGVFEGVRETASPPPGSVYLQQALLSAGIGGKALSAPGFLSDPCG